MSEQRQSANGGAALLLALVHGRGFVWAIGLLACIALIAVAVRSWQVYHPLVMQDPRYQVALDDIQITAPPAWIRTGADVIKRQVADEAQWQFPLWLREPQLTWEVAREFSRHPWVLQVRRAEKFFPAAVRVDVVYREPVAIVKVVNAEGKPSWVPVDGVGWVLPTEDFLQEDRDKYLAIRIPGAISPGLTGPWPDGPVPGSASLVHGAAKIAALLAPYREALQVTAVVVTQPELAQTDLPLDFSLELRSGELQWWGNPPGDERMGEKSAAEKLQAFLQAAGVGENLRQAQLPVPPVPPTASRSTSRRLFSTQRSATVGRAANRTQPGTAGEAERSDILRQPLSVIR